MPQFSHQRPFGLKRHGESTFSIIWAESIWETHVEPIRRHFSIRDDNSMGSAPIQLRTKPLHEFLKHQTYNAAETKPIQLV